MIVHKYFQIYNLGICISAEFFMLLYSSYLGMFIELWNFGMIWWIWDFFLGPVASTENMKNLVKPYYQKALLDAAMKAQSSSLFFMSLLSFHLV
jgi:hypothetical protein